MLTAAARYGAMQSRTIGRRVATLTRGGAACVPRAVDAGAPVLRAMKRKLTCRGHNAVRMRLPLRDVRHLRR